MHITYGSKLTVQHMLTQVTRHNDFTQDQQQKGGGESAWKRIVLRKV